MLECYVKGRNLVNGNPKKYDIVEGAVFTEYYNETLDSGTIILAHITEEIEIEPYDVVVISSKTGSACPIKTRWMLVDTVNCYQTCLDPVKYKYEISLFSTTKLLEGILLPSLSITRLKDTPARSVWYYLNEYLNEYCPRTQSSAYGPNTMKFAYDQTVQDRFENIECPELQWNEPTLREVITDLMMVDDCIPIIVEDNEIQFIDISQNGAEISQAQRNGLNYIHKTHSSTDYVSELKNKLRNSIGDGETVSVCENITWRNYDEYVISTENLKVETLYPIWDLKRFVMKSAMIADISMTPRTGGQTVTVSWGFNFDYDLMNYILEYGEWQTKDIYYAGVGSFSAPTTDYQNACLYYIRGQRGIYNFSAKQDQKFLWIDTSKTVYELITEMLPSDNEIIQDYIDAIGMEHPEDYFIVVQNKYVQNWKKTYFEVEYEMLEDHTFFASKGYLPRNKRQVMDNQSQSYSNIYHYGILEYAKANRLGNKIKLVNGRYKVQETDMPQLAQTIDGSVIFKKEIAVYDNYIKVNYQATENYVLRDYFTGVQAKKRSWKILTGNEAFTREDVLKFYVCGNSIDNDMYKLPVYEAITIKGTIDKYLENFNYCVVQFKDKNNVIYPNDNLIKYKGISYNVDGYLMEFAKCKCGNSALFTIKMKDNAIVGTYVADNDFAIGQSRVMTQKNCSYVDADGENVGGYIYFFKEMIDIYSSPNKEAICNLYPAVKMQDVFGNDESNLVAKIPFNFHKDNKEITQLTVQFEVNNDANDIFLGKK